MATTISRNNTNKPAPKWFRRLKKSLTLLADTAAVIMLASGYAENSLAMLITRIGISGLLESAEALLANGEEYVNTDNYYKKFYKNKNFLLILVCSLLFSCSPAKRTSKQVYDIEALQKQMAQKNEAILAKGIADYIKNNPCVYPELDLDSLCDLYTPDNSIDREYITADLKPYFKWEYDTTMSGNIYTDHVPQREVFIQRKNILVPTPDNRLVNLLKDSLQVARDRYLECNSKQEGRYELFKAMEESSKPGSWHFNNWGWLAIVLLLLLTGLSILFKSKIAK